MGRGPLREREDAFGHALLDHLDGCGGVEIVERDDGYVSLSAGAATYFAERDGWSDLDVASIDRVRGRVLDVGCGAGRFALHLQHDGHPVTAIDASPLAVEVCRRRGVRDARVLPVEQVGPALGVFDTIVMLGNNLGLLGGWTRGRRLLRAFARLTAPDARIVAQTMDPYHTDDPFHHVYHERNRRRGRMPGQIRMRVRYRGWRTPWFDYLLVSREELAGLIEGTGWRLAERVGDERPGYVAVLARDAHE